VAARSTNSPNLASDFLHLLIGDDNLGEGYGATTDTFSGELSKRGSLVAVSSALAVAQQVFPPPVVIKQDELLMCLISHEITHMLYERRTPPFANNEHTGDPDNDGVITHDVNGDGMVNDADKACLMHQAFTQKRLELATVTFFPLVQEELKVKSNQALVL
jgi:hypothetical protein